jgi:hypothetical protein
MTRRDLWGALPEPLPGAAPIIFARLWTAADTFVHRGKDTEGQADAWLATLPATTEKVQAEVEIPGGIHLDAEFRPFHRRRRLTLRQGAALHHQGIAADRRRKAPARQASATAMRTLLGLNQPRSAERRGGTETAGARS